MIATYRPPTLEESVPTTPAAKRTATTPVFTPAPPGWRVWRATAPDDTLTDPVWWEPLAGWLAGWRSDDPEPLPVTLDSDGVWCCVLEESDHLLTVQDGNPWEAPLVIDAAARHRERAGLAEPAADEVGRIVARAQQSSATASALPVAVGDVVALGLVTSPVGDITCPVGEVTAVGPDGARLALYQWLSGVFDTPAWVAWSRVLEVRWAERDGDGVFLMDPLADFQTRWMHGAEYLREQKRQGG